MSEPVRISSSHLDTMPEHAPEMTIGTTATELRPVETAPQTEPVVARQMGEIACRPVVAARRREAPRPRPIAEWSTVLQFADAKGGDKTFRMTDRLFNGLHSDQLTPHGRARGLRDLTDKLWTKPHGRQGQGFHIDLVVAYHLVRQVALDNAGYRKERAFPSFKDVKPGDISLFAEYLNATLRIPADKQLPLSPFSK